jgi:glycosidase
VRQSSQIKQKLGISKTKQNKKQKTTITNKQTNKLVIILKMKTFILCIVLCACAANAAVGPPPNIQAVGKQGVLEWSGERLADEEKLFAQSGQSRFQSPSFWGAEVVYSLMPDRFANGDVSNDLSNVPVEQAKYGNTSSLFGLPSYRHGGDIQGIINRLDYFVDLGATSLWITPVFYNADGSYHSYCVSSPSDVDPNYGSWDDYRRLIAEAHRRGLRIVQDLVINHLCAPATRYARQPADHERCAATLDSQFWAGTPVGDDGAQGELAMDPAFYGPLASRYFFNRCGANSAGDTGGQGAAAVYGDFTALMFDFATYNYDFQEIMASLYTPLIAMGVDGFRLDAAKHVTEDFIAYFSTQVRAYARSIGKQNFLVVGEVAASADWIGRRLGNMFSSPTNPSNEHDPSVPRSLTTRIESLESLYLANPAAPYPGLNAVYDFAESGTSRAALLSQRASDAVASYYNSDNYHTIAGQADPRLSWTLLAIHDWPRFLVADRQQGAKSVSGAAYLLTAPGTPIIWQGIEQGMNQDCLFDSMHSLGNATASVQQMCEQGGADELKRQDMMANGPWRLGSAVGSIQAQAYIGPWRHVADPSDWRQDSYLKTDHAIYRAFRKAARVRTSCSALTQGSIVWRDAEPQVGGLLVFSRIFNAIEMLVIVNPGSRPRALTKYPIDGAVNFNAAFDVYKNLFFTEQQGTVGYENGEAYLYLSNATIEANSFMAYTHESNVGAYDGYIQANYCKN